MQLRIVLLVTLLVGGFYVARDVHLILGIVMLLVGLVVAKNSYDALRNSLRKKPATPFTPTFCPYTGAVPDNAYSPYTVKRVPANYASVGGWMVVPTEFQYLANCTLCGLDQIVPGPQTLHP